MFKCIENYFRKEEVDVPLEPTEYHNVEVGGVSITNMLIDLEQAKKDIELLKSAVDLIRNRFDEPLLYKRPSQGLVMSEEEAKAFIEKMDKNETQPTAD